MSSEASSRKIERLIQVIADNTANKSLQWATTPDEDAFRLASDTANVQIQKFEVNDDEMEQSLTRRVLEIFNRQGRLVEEYKPRDEIQVKAFDELFDLARRSAYDTDDLLDKLLEEIGGERS